MENAVAGFFPGAAPSMAAGHRTAGVPFALPTSSARRAPTSLHTASSRLALVCLPTASSSRSRLSLPTASATRALSSLPTAGSSSCCLSCLGRRTGSASEGTASRIVRRGVRAASTSEAATGAEDYFCGAAGSTAVFYTAVGAEAASLSASSGLAVPVAFIEVEVWSATGPAANPSPSCSPCPCLGRAALASEVVRAASAPSPSATKAHALHTATGAESSFVTCACDCTVAFVAPATKASPVSASSRSVPVISTEVEERSATASAANPSPSCCACLLRVGPARKVIGPASASEAAVLSPSAKEADALHYTATGAESRVLCCACDSLSAGFASATTASSRSASTRAVPFILTELELWSAKEPAASPSASCSNCLVCAALASAGVPAASASSPSATKAHALCLTSAAVVASISAPTPTWAGSAGDTEFGVIYTATDAEGPIRFDCLASALSDTSHAIPVVILTEAEIRSATEPAANPSPSYSACLLRAELARKVIRASSASEAAVLSPSAKDTGALYTGAESSVLFSACGQANVSPVFLSNTIFSAFDSLNGIPRGVARNCFLTKASSWREKAQRRGQCSARRGQKERTLDWDRIARLCILCALLQKSGYFSLPPPRTAVQKPQVDWPKVVNRVKMVLLVSCLYVGYTAANGNAKMSLTVDVIDKSMKAFKVVDEVTKFIK